MTEATLNGQVIGQTERATRAVLDRLLESARRERLVAGSERVELTEAGRARHSTIMAGVGRITQRLYAGLPREELVVAARVLETLTEGARAALSRPNGP